MSEYRSSRWSIDLLPGWSAEEQPECVAFFRDDGVGALQISAYQHDSGTIPADDLDDFKAGEFPDDARLEPVTCGSLSGVGVDYVADGNFWLKRWLDNGPLLLFRDVQLRHSRPDTRTTRRDPHACDFEIDGRGITNRTIGRERRGRV